MLNMSNIRVLAASNVCNSSEESFGDGVSFAELVNEERGEKNILPCSCVDNFIIDYKQIQKFPKRYYV